MSDNNYKKGLKRDLIIAFSIKVFLIVLLITGHKYYKKTHTEETERYPIFKRAHHAL